MLIPFFVAGVATLLQGAPVQAVAAARRDVPSSRQTSARDSLRALRTARRAQETFELVRRQYLPREFGVGSHHCDVRVGRWCVWNDETNDRMPPAEASRITEAREKLLRTLDTLGVLFPGNEWIAAQEVRYLIEAKRFADAVHVAERCTASGSRYLCRTWAGVAFHDSGAVADAHAVFSGALAAMPDSIRCQWTDISVLLEDEIGDRYGRASCAGRPPLEEAYWRLTTPLYLRNHDFENEYMARVARGEMERESRTPMGSTAEPAFRETALRYGYDTWFVRDDPPAGSMAEAPIAGYRAGGSGYNFVPASRAFLAPAALTHDDWDLKLRTARTLYGPAYARHFKSLDKVQLSLFRRGDSALVIATYDVRGDTLFASDSLEAGLFALPADSMMVGEPHGTVTPAARAKGILMTNAAWRPMVVSVELLDRRTSSAARLRIGLRPPSSASRVALSDLVMFAPRSADSLPHQLRDVLPLALSGDRIGRDRLLGLFWETYGVRPEGEHVAVAITIERIQEGWMRRTAQRLHLATPFSPMKVQWTEVPDRTDGIASRSVTLDLSQLAPGRYEITLTVNPTDGAPMAAKREITLDR